MALSARGRRRGPAASGAVCTCGERAVLPCGQCRAVWYCGPKCQRAAWTEHKCACRAAAEGAAGAAGGGDVLVEVRLLDGESEAGWAVVAVPAPCARVAGPTDGDDAARARTAWLMRTRAHVVPPGWSHDACRCDTTCGRVRV